MRVQRIINDDPMEKLPGKASGNAARKRTPTAGLLRNADYIHGITNKGLSAIDSAKPS